MDIDKYGIERCNQAFQSWNMQQRRNKPDVIVFWLKLKLQYIGVDAQSELVHTLIGKAANVHNVTQAQGLLHGDETDVFGDAGYLGVEKREGSLELPVTWHIAMRPSKRKALPKTTAGKLMEKLEHPKAGIRAKVEHPFHVVKNLFMHRKSATKEWPKIMLIKPS